MTTIYRRGHTRDESMNGGEEEKDWQASKSTGTVVSLNAAAQNLKLAVQ